MKELAPPYVTVTVDAAAIGMICKEASEMSWMEPETRARIVATCKKVQVACAKVGVKLEMGDGL